MNLPENKQLKFDPLGDGISCLELIDYMGNDQSIVRAARVSYQRDQVTPDPIKDENLIRYMLRHHHGTPFEHTSITLHVALPIFVARQWIRHRIGVSFNEISRRYSTENIEFYYPKQWRYQDTKNKQASIKDTSEAMNTAMTNVLKKQCQSAEQQYQYMIGLGIGNEMARMLLPQNLYTRWYFTANLRSLMLFHDLRADSHAQFEIQVYANAISEIMKELFPLTWKIFLELKAEKE